MFYLAYFIPVNSINMDNVVTSDTTSGCNWDLVLVCFLLYAVVDKSVVTFLYSYLQIRYTSCIFLSSNFFWHFHVLEPLMGYDFACTIPFIFSWYRMTEFSLMTLVVLSIIAALRIVVPRLANNLPPHSVVYITNAVPVIL